MSHLCALEVHQLVSPFAKLLSYIWFYFRSAVKCTYSLYVLGLRGRNSYLLVLRTAGAVCCITQHYAHAFRPTSASTYPAILDSDGYLRRVTKKNETCFQTYCHTPALK